MEHLYHFNLTQDPFQNEPDLRFYFESEMHRRAQLRIDRALRQSKGLVVLTGEGGTGKSLLARRLFEALEEEIFEAALMVMMQGTADATSVLRRFASQLGVEDPPTERAKLIGMLYEQLAIVREDGRHVVLILDDAHTLGQDAMAEIGGLMNLEYEDRRLMSLLLVGLPSLDGMIAKIPSLGERVDVRVPLQPLAEDDAQNYVAHRLQAAGGDPGIFEPAAIQSAFKLGGGRPRRINALADNALFEAYLAGRTAVTAEDVENAGRDLAFETSAQPVPAQPQPATASATVKAPKSPPVVTEALSAATEIAMDPMEDTFGPMEGLVSHSLGEAVSVDPFESTAGAPSGGAEATMLIDDLLEPAASPTAGAEVDLSSLLDDDMSDGGLDLELADEADPGDSLPSFSAENASGSMAEATRIAMPEDDDLLDSGVFSADPIEMADATDSDEIDDLFVELLDE